MKTLYAAFAVVAALSAVAHADQIQCSSADGKVQYLYRRSLPGGAPPPIGHGPSVSANWFVDGSELGANAGQLSPQLPERTIRTSKISSEVIEVYWTTADVQGRTYIVLCQSRLYRGPMPPSAARR